MTRRITISLIAITCFGVLCPITANAENPLDKLIPRGTLFKKLKKEIAEEFGGDKAVTPAVRRAPTPAVARPDNRRRQMSTQPTASRQSQQRMTNPRPQQSKQPTLADSSFAANEQRAPSVASKSTTCSTTSDSTLWQQCRSRFWRCRADGKKQQNGCDSFAAPR